MKSWNFLAVFSLSVFGSFAGAATIDFEGTGAPLLFDEATALTDATAASGVNFAGPAGGDGGAVLNDLSNLGIAARSGTDFLAFNAAAVLMDGATPQGPETILFDSLVSSVSIWASGGSFDGLFQLEAFDASDVSLGTVQVPTFADWELLSFVGPSISKVQLTELSGIQAYVYDDLSFEPVALSNVPEPGAVILFASGLVGLAGLRRFKERHFPGGRN
ncbi:MAG: PEP-CTERM sorting domain-containing protein [Bryobacterales bacterium]